MSLVDKIVHKKNGFFVYECQIYVPDEQGRSGNINGINLRNLFSVEEVFCRNRGDFRTPQTFINQGVLSKLRRMKVKESKEFNYNFDDIWSRHFPLGFGKKDWHLYVPDPKGELVLSGKRYRKQRTVSRRTNIESKPIDEQESCEVEIGNQGNKYLVSKKIPAFVMKGSDGHYRFSNVWVSMEMNVRGNEIAIKMPRSRYKINHPFVYSGRSICFNGNERWKKMGLKFQQRKVNYSLLRNIQEAFYEAQTNLVNGYKNGVSPVKFLNRLNFPNEFLCPLQKNEEPNWSSTETIFEG